MFLIINTTLLTNLKLKGYNNIHVFDKKAMNHVFAMNRRENFLLFLIRCGFIAYKGKRACENRHKVFEIEDMYRSIMKFV